MADANDKNTRLIMGKHVDQAIARGEIRAHEREKTISLAANNWVGQTGNGHAAEAAIKAVKDGLA
jgi:hypothetical protein